MRGPHGSLHGCRTPLHIKVSFVRGRNINGQLGHGKVQDEWVPQLVQAALVGTKVVGVDACDEYIVVLTEAGSVPTFGDCRSGRLGHGTNTD